MPVVLTKEQRFWAKLDKSVPAPAHCAESGCCWVWTGHCKKGTHPYGMSCGKLTHRLAWEFRNGKVPSGLYVLHKCDRCNCCNPAHLFLGTQKSNMDDMRAKGRQQCVPDKLDRTCLHCGVAFQVRPSESYRKYCSHPCSTNSPAVGRKAGAKLSPAGLAKFRESRGWKLVEKNCLRCGKPFSVRPCYSHRTFCGRFCAVRHRHDSP